MRLSPWMLIRIPLKYATKIGHACIASTSLSVTLSLGDYSTWKNNCQLHFLSEKQGSVMELGVICPCPNNAPRQQRVKATNRGKLLCLWPQVVALIISLPEHKPELWFPPDGACYLVLTKFTHYMFVFFPQPLWADPPQFYDPFFTCQVLKTLSEYFLSMAI